MERELKILERTLLFVAITVPSVTAFGYFVGPKPYFQTSKLLNDPLTGLVDTRDSLILLGWYAIAAISSVFVYWQIFQKNSNELVPVPRSKRLRGIPVYGLILIFVCNLFLDLDLDGQGVGNIPTLTIREAFIATLFCLILGFVWFRSKNYTFLIRSIIVCGLLSRPLSVFIQTPSSLQDEWHFNFTANELAAPAAGMIPMVNFLPWYTNLLGFPIAPILRLAPSESVMVILIWLLFLQAICLALPTIIAYIIAGKQAALLSFLLLISLMTAQPKINSYFQSFPIRTIFPCLLLGVLVFSVQNIQTFRFRDSIFLGVLSGFALLNNLESGLPSLLALIFTLLLLYRSISNFTRAVLSIFFGVFLVFGLYSLLVLSTGKALHFSYMITPLKIVVSGGFFQVPMTVGGYHNIFAIFFVSGMATASFLFFRAQKIGSVNLKRIAALMSFSSSWGLIGMVYFSGRSFTSTLLAGSTYALGLLAVSIMIWIFIDRQFVSDVLMQKNRYLNVISLLVVMLFCYISITVLTRMDAVNVLRQAGTEWDEETNRTANLKSAEQQINQLKLDNQSRPLQVVQIFQLSNILELTTGIEAGLIVTDPRYLSMFREFQDLQCQYILSSEFNIIIEDSQLDDSFEVFSKANPTGSLKDLTFCNESMNLNEIPTLDQDATTRFLKVDVKEK
ncbi:MAG: hypothetical protein F2884_00815 [Actinobacteria bacterium]|uniref:Unannotated protein n=1 Tax=freshwater metagenome TaxID=449393 RepID=A0A6J7N9E6_9ZZZZ|nr:hypothetical protein [Actinomycetota bacterium]